MLAFRRNSSHYICRCFFTKMFLHDIYTLNYFRVSIYNVKTSPNNLTLTKLNLDGSSCESLQSSIKDIPLLLYRALNPKPQIQPDRPRGSDEGRDAGEQHEAECPKAPHVAPFPQEGFGLASWSRSPLEGPKNIMGRGLARTLQMWVYLAVEVSSPYHWWTRDVQMLLSCT